MESEKLPLGGLEIEPDKRRLVRPSLRPFGALQVQVQGPAQAAGPGVPGTTLCPAGTTGTCMRLAAAGPPWLYEPLSWHCRKGQNGAPGPILPGPWEVGPIGAALTLTLTP
jgi:hypothetical protein